MTHSPSPLVCELTSQCPSLALTAASSSYLLSQGTTTLPPGTAGTPPAPPPDQQKPMPSSALTRPSGIRPLALFFLWALHHLNRGWSRATLVSPPFDAAWARSAANPASHLSS